MTPERWQKIKSILDEALDLTPDARKRFLSESCGADADLRHEVEKLLEFEEPASDIFDHDALQGILASGSFAKTYIGRQIGRYKITGALGAGGMGAVFLAERAGGEFQQKVALKLIRRVIVSDHILRRFVNERQILASLDHPNIAHLIDGGTTDDDLPYFVMEYVRGESIIEFARSRNLSLEERLDLFRKVCAAVAYAHRNLVIHRDLKPSNILVTDDGTPKLLDFGIAKLLKNEASDQTRTHQFAFTPEYASPEQIKGEKLTTATDVYSLGIILYELLTGTRPFKFEGKNLGEVLETLTKIEPPRPSLNKNQEFDLSGSKHLKGDLDNIVLKALKKEPERRYSSVEQFAEDIRRHLKGLPVSARKDTFRYRAEKFISRNPLGISALLIALTALVGGILAVGFQARIANAERLKAEQRFSDMRQLANSLMFEINEEIEKSPIKARELLVNRTIEYLDKLAIDESNDLSLQSELAASYEKVGDVQSRLYNSNIGDTKGAIESYRKALELRKTIYDKDPKNLDFGAHLADSYGRMGEISAKSGNLAAAVENHRQAVEINKKLVGSQPKDIEFRRRLARSYSMLGQSLLRCCSLNEVTENYRASLTAFEELSAENPTDRRFRRSVATLRMYLGYALGEIGDFALASENYRQALIISRRLAADDPSDKPAQNLFSAALWHSGVGLRAEGRTREALDFFKQALENTEKLKAGDENDSHWRNEVGDCYLEIGITLGELGETGAALKNLDLALENFEAVRRSDSENALVRRQIAFTLRNRADVLLKSNRFAEALPIYRQAAGEFELLTTTDPANLERRHDLAHCLLKTAETEIKTRDFSSARQSLEKSHAFLDELVIRVPQNFYYQRDLANAQSLLTQLPD